MPFRVFHSVLLLLAACTLLEAAPALIPLPRKVALGDERVAIPADCTIALDRPEDGLRLIGMLREAGLAPKKHEDGGTPFIIVKRGEVENPHGFEGAYRIETSPRGMVITTRDRAGAGNATETLRQMILKEAGGLTVPTGRIDDWPAFPLRGFLLDTGRNYQSPALIKEQIEVMARYKLNVFHFHFTDNPGWRLESKVHPKVTDPGSMSRQPGKFYTQREFRELVAFCHERNITLVPELDMPGHSASFRKALGIQSMNDAATRRILKELLTELASLAPADEMPYLHLGTDEVRGREEQVDATFLPEMSAHVRSLGRKVIGWRQGIEDPADHERITQLWARAEPLPDNPFLDSRSTYLNHMDAFDAVSCLFFQQSCRRPHGDARALGGILCSWPDIRIAGERDQLKQNPIYPGIVTFGESIWRGVEQDDKEAYWANLPAPDSGEFTRFREFESRLLDHKARFFTGREFPYVKQTDLRWKIIGPFPNDGDVMKTFPVEDGFQERYEAGGKEYVWRDRDFAGATVHLKHFFGFGAPVKENEGTCYALTHVWSPRDQAAPAWIGFQGWSRSDRRGGPTPSQGEWHHTRPWIRVNGTFIEPPVWQSPKLTEKSDEIPFTNDDYFYREPSQVKLRAGWNEVLLKIPHRKRDWKWMFTFVPLDAAGELRYSSQPHPES